MPGRGRRKGKTGESLPGISAEQSAELWAVAKRAKDRGGLSLPPPLGGMPQPVGSPTIPPPPPLRKKPPKGQRRVPEKRQEKLGRPPRVVPPSAEELRAAKREAKRRKPSRVKLPPPPMDQGDFYAGAWEAELARRRASPEHRRGPWQDRVAEGVVPPLAFLDTMPEPRRQPAGPPGMVGPARPSMPSPQPFAETQAERGYDPTHWEQLAGHFGPPGPGAFPQPLEEMATQFPIPISPEWLARIAEIPVRPMPTILGKPLGRGGMAGFGSIYLRPDYDPLTAVHEYAHALERQVPRGFRPDYTELQRTGDYPSATQFYWAEGNPSLRARLYMGQPGMRMAEAYAEYPELYFGGRMDIPPPLRQYYPWIDWERMGIPLPATPPGSVPSPTGPGGRIPLEARQWRAPPAHLPTR